MLRSIYIKTVLVLVLMIKSLVSMATDELFSQFINGPDSLSTLRTVDDKFRNAKLSQFDWGKIASFSAKNVISLELRYDTLLPVWQDTFSMKVKVRVTSYSTITQTIPDSTDYELILHYDPQLGAEYRYKDLIEFDNGMDVTVKILSIECDEFDNKIPLFFRLKNEIYVNKKYVFSPDEIIKISEVKAPVLTDPSIELSWNFILGAEEYDLEWVMYDSTSRFKDTIQRMINNLNSVNEIVKNSLFRHNSTRVTVSENSYAFNVIATHHYLLVRIRQVHYDNNNDRIAAGWNYIKVDNNQQIAAIWNIHDLWHEPSLNWTYTATYAEDGKKKEVMSYFDGSGKERQMVTQDNSSATAIVAENVYDEFGRQAGSILPAPTLQKSFKYFKGFNKNINNVPYDYRSILLSEDECNTAPLALSNTSGAANYYSANNEFISGGMEHHKFIPLANGYPLSITRFTNDNTGRVSVQGGVGLKFQPGVANGNKVTKFSYGVPSQRELDIIFGNDVGYANHYLKQMVVDPNGQVSVSYTNAAGQTIATALAGEKPDIFDTIQSVGYSETKTFELISSGGFAYDESDRTIKASSTYLSTIPNNPATFNYSIEKLIHVFNDKQGPICSNCYYDLSISLYDDCGNRIDTMTTPVQIGSLEANCLDTAIVLGQFTALLSEIGEYHLYIGLQLTNASIDQKTDYYITTRQQNGSLRKIGDFIIDELDKTSFEECFDDCYTCFDKLGTLQEFKDTLNGMILFNGVNYTGYESLIDSLITVKYNELYARCQAASLNCGVSDCDSYREQMLRDVSPFGQYALFDTLLNNQFMVVETSLNILDKHFRNEFLTNPDTLIIDDVVYQIGIQGFSLEMLVRNWRPRFAERFLKYHPEYCQLQFCESNSSEKKWDDYIRKSVNTVDRISSIPRTTGLVYSKTNIAWLVNNDPFMLKYPARYRDSLVNDLQNFTKAVLGIPETVLPVKNIYQYIDYTLYCDAQQQIDSAAIRNNWENCTVDNECRIADREWNLYKQFYLLAKEKYYNKIKKEQVCVDQCEVGTVFTGDCYAPADFSLEPISTLCLDGITPGWSYKLIYKGGILSDSVTVKIYIPSEYGVGTTRLINIAATQSEVQVCLPLFVPLSMISIVEVECHKVENDNCIYGPARTENLTAGYTKTGDSLFKRIQITSNSYLEQVIQIIPGNSQHEIPDSSFYPHTSITKQFYGCYTVRYQGQLYNYNNVWVAYIDNYPCADNVIEINAQWKKLSGGRILQKDSVAASTFLRRSYTIIDGTAGNPPADNIFCENGTVLSKTFYECLTVKDVVTNTYTFYQNVWVGECRRDICEDVTPVVLSYRINNTTYWHNNTVYSVKNSSNYNTGKCPTTNDNYEDCLIIQVGTNRYVYQNSKLESCTNCDSSNPDFTYTANTRNSSNSFTLWNGQQLFIFQNTNPGNPPPGVCPNAITEWYACLRVSVGANHYYFYGATVAKCPPAGCPNYYTNVVLGDGSGKVVYTQEGVHHIYPSLSGTENVCPVEYRSDEYYDCISYYTGNDPFGVPDKEHSGVYVIKCFMPGYVPPPPVGEPEFVPLPPGTVLFGGSGPENTDTINGFTYYFEEDFYTASNTVNGCENPQPDNLVFLAIGNSYVSNPSATVIFQAGIPAVDGCLEPNLYLEFRNLSTQEFFCRIVGWDGQRNLEIPMNGLSAGQWRLTVSGFDCSANSCDTLLKYKKPVFPRLEKPATSGGAATVLRMVSNNQAVALDIVKTNCESYVESWLRNMDACLQTYDSATIDLLIKRLVAVCQNGASEDNLYGATTVRPGSLTSYNDTSFEEVLYDVLGLLSFNMNCNPWLLENPYPINSPRINTERPISKSNPENCHILDSLQQQYPLSSMVSFHAYLMETFGAAYNYDSVMLNTFIESCDNCSNLLRYDLPAPQFLLPASEKGCIDKTTYEAAKLAFSGAMTGIQESHVNYPVMLQTFMNHRFGFGLTGEQYLDYEEQISTETDAYLCDNPRSAFIAPDKYACIRELVQQAVSQAQRDYDNYIAAERNRFREQYIEICANNTNNVQLTVRDKIYHFTLYYYDQAGQLIRTVPPEGVRLLSDAEIEAVQLLRESNGDCSAAAFADTDWKRLSASINNAMAAEQLKSLEFWIDLRNADKSFRLATEGGEHFWRGTVQSNKLYFDWHHLNEQDTVVLFKRFSVNLPAGNDSALHLVVQSYDWDSNELEVYLNGAPATGMSVAEAYPQAFVKSSFVNRLATISGYRTYNRKLMAKEVRINYLQQCRVPAKSLLENQSNLLSWFAPFSLQYDDNHKKINNHAVVIVHDPGKTEHGYVIDSVSNNFTLDFWVYINNEDAAYRNLYNENNSSNYVNDQREYIIYPEVPSGGGGTIGVAVGQRFISVVERSATKNPSVLVYRRDLSQNNLFGWRHIAVTYINKVPRLYVDGVLVKTGVVSTLANVYPSYNLVKNIPGHAFAIDEIKIWNRVLPATEISSIAARNAQPAFQAGGLLVYYPFSKMDGSEIIDFSGNDRHYRVTPGMELTYQYPDLPGDFDNYLRVNPPPEIRGITPRHRLLTNYVYNSLGQVAYQSTPDAGRSEFWYDRLGRLVYSQNAQQAIAASGKLSLSYTRYEPILGRITEVGKLKSTTVGQLKRFMSEYEADSIYNAGEAVEITRTFYDHAVSAGFSHDGNLNQKNLRNRVAATLYRSAKTADTANIESVTYYSYDLSGNVKTQWNYIAGLGLKRMDYDYDEQSGKVNMLRYQQGHPDAFYYRYEYDSENRLTGAYSGNRLLPNTSRIIEEREDAAYYYYLHGPLARVELGEFKVQGVDYAYTLQGWLKGINAQRMDISWDMGKDGAAGSRKFIGKDVFAFGLEYYTGDYHPVTLNAQNTNNPFRIRFRRDSSLAPTHDYYQVGADLYNGNISNWMVSLRGGRNGLPYAQVHRYDQLNRLTRLRTIYLYTPGQLTWQLSEYRRNWESFSYDGNGNIKTLRRYPNELSYMDNQTFHYQTATDPVTQQTYLLNNRLTHVSDYAVAGFRDSDIDNQSSGNYSYDAIGNLTGDVSEGLSVNWNVYGKIAGITKGSGSESTAIVYGYDASGSRVKKTVISGGNTVPTYYVKDASGNVLATYEQQGSETLWKEQHLYGSSRLGVWYPDAAITDTQALKINGLIGRRHYELSNHLGNVMAVFSDKKVSQPDGTFYPEMVNVYDYYAFGGLREFSKDSSILALGRRYRYGFNGKENDHEVKGEGNQQDYGMRIYDPRLGRFLSVDPISGDYPWYTPYQFAGNTPIQAIDLDGLEPVKAPSMFNKLWNFFVQDYHFNRAKEFAAQHKIDQSYLFVVTGSQDVRAHRSVNPVRIENNTSIIVYHPVEQSDGSIKIYKHVFRQSSGKTLVSGSGDDTMWGEWDLDFDFNGNPIPNEEDRSWPILDAPAGGGGGKTVVNGVQIAISGSKGSRTLYPIIKGTLHHLATNKNFIRGQQWSKKFEPLFKKAGYSLDDAVNKVFVPGHRGPHPDAYHKYVYDEIINATKGLSGSDYKTALDGVLNNIASEAQKVGSTVNKLLTGQ